MHSMMFGTICIWMALLGSISAAVLYWMVGRGREDLRGWARLSYVLVAQGIIWAAAHLMFLILNHRYEVNYVAEYSSSDLPTASVFGLQVPFYLISCFWAGQQGTFFLWATYGCILGVIFMTKCRRSFEAPAMAVVSIIQAFLSLLLVSASPFVLAQAGHIPSEGKGLNILLQNHWMVIHPPIMFLGFTSLAFPFAVGVAALVRKDWDEWVDVAWPWALFAWCALGSGLFLGGYWAYTVLGWGGFWGWDNVENSSLIPWLATTALLHGLMLQRARGSMKRANLLFALTPYILVLFGSFLTRSGILADFSVHSFAAPARVIFNILLVYVCVFFVASAGLLLCRVRSIPSVEAFEHEASRGFFFVVGCWLIYCSSIIVLIGTSWPLITQAWGKPANAGQSFYNHWLFPVAILLCIMMGITPFLKWHGKPAEATGRALGSCMLGALVLSLLLTLGNGVFYRQSLEAPAEALIRSNPSAYSAPASPRPSGVLLNGRTSAAGAVTTGTDTSAVSINGLTFRRPDVPHSGMEAYTAALHMPNGYAYPVFAFAALFCILANGLMVYKLTGLTRRSWLPAGGQLTHIGVGVLLIGVITSMNYGGDAVLNLDPGQKKAHAGDNSLTFPDAVPSQAFGHSFTFQGAEAAQNGQTAIMRIAVTTGDDTSIAKPRLTYAKDGNMVHFPSIFKYWNEDLYLSPIKLPGQGLNLGFHAAIEVTHNGETTTLTPGLAFTDDGARPLETPEVPGGGYQLALKNIQTPTKDSPDRNSYVELALAHAGSFQTNPAAAPSIRLDLHQSGDLQGYHVRYVGFTVDQGASQMFKDYQVAQVEVSTKPLINLVWLGTFFIIGGGIMAARRRGLETARRNDRQAE